MTRLIIPAIVAMLISGSASVTFARFNEGLAAYHRGDYLVSSIGIIHINDGLNHSVDRQAPQPDVILKRSLPDDVF
jgi:hypothetical protein